MSTEAIDPKYANYKRPKTLQQRLDDMGSLAGILENQPYRVAVVVGRWHDYVVDRLLQGALDSLNECGVSDDRIEIISAPGAYEIPLVVKALCETERFGAIITLGCVIKGETPHFDFVAGECASGLAQVSREYNIPVGFGVLTVNTVEQAMARAEEGEANKGREAVLAAVEVADLLGKLKQ